MVVNDIDDDLYAFTVQSLDHGLELRQLLSQCSRRGVAGLRRKKADRIVSPIVREAAVDEKFVCDELVNRHHLYGCDPQGSEIVDNGWMGESRISASQFLRHFGVTSGESSYMHFIDQRLVPRSSRRRVLSPTESRVHDHALRYSVGAVPLIFR